MNQLVTSIEETFKQCLEIAKRKNADYAGDTDPFANFRLVEKLSICSVETGILVRLTDKYARIINLLDKQAQVKDESVEDTIRDSINYWAILLAYRETK